MLIFHRNIDKKLMYCQNRILLYFNNYLNLFYLRQLPAKHSAKPKFQTF